MRDIRNECVIRDVFYLYNLFIKIADGNELLG